VREFLFDPVFEAVIFYHEEAFVLDDEEPEYLADL
jgi:hypothetical protein